MNDKAQGVLAVMERDGNEALIRYANLPDYLPSEMSRRARESQDARVTVAELIEAMRGLMEGYEARMGDWENADFNDCYRKAEAALARADGDA